jgi:hypothetical protein
MKSLKRKVSKESSLAIMGHKEMQKSGGESQTQSYFLCNKFVILLGCVFCGTICLVKLMPDLMFKINPCGGGVEYVHRDPASRKR